MSAKSFDMKKHLSVFLLLPVVMVGCNKNFLNKLPQGELTQATAFVTYANFETYTWGLYDYFNGYGENGQVYPGPAPSQEFDADDLSETLAGNQSPYAFQTKIVPAAGPAPSNSITSYSQETAVWDFSYVRRVNIMLDAIATSQMSQAQQNHWRSVGYFFRALRYYDLIAAYGNVPWIEHTLSDDSTSIIYGPATPRDTVAQNILGDLEWADANIGAGSPDGVNTINQACVDALVSRFGLFEGTYRKYHGLNNANTYLQACVTYSQPLMAEYPTIMSSYDNVYNTQDLTGQPGIILFKQYTPNLVEQELPRYIGSTAWDADVTKDAVDSYLCTDGMPISTSPLYQGDMTMYAQFRNRDRRLYFTVLPPYKVITGAPNNISTFTYTNNPEDSEYIDLMNDLPGNTNKALPMLQWSVTMQTGYVINMSPHFYSYNGGEAQAISQLGFLFWKWYNREPLDNNSLATNDCPLFRIEEVMLNDAEAQWELGQFSQAIANQTINVLRSRANVASMIVAAIGSNFDLNRDPAVDPVLWEIRRERRVELMGDGFRFNDLKRWDKGTYLNKQELGVYVNNADFGNSLKIYGGGGSGYVYFYGAPLGWLDEYYLEPIPTQELALDSLLVQNPGW
jgi:hypothetical protein